MKLFDDECESRRSSTSIVSSNVFLSSEKQIRDKIISSSGEFAYYTNKNAVKYLHDLQVIKLFQDDQKTKKVYRTE